MFSVQLIAVLTQMIYLFLLLEKEVTDLELLT